MIKSYNGGKLGKDGIVRYPDGVNVDKAHAARSQAFFDMAYGEKAGGRSDMADLYGEDYTNEIRRLANLKTGDFSWAELPADQRPNTVGGIPNPDYTDNSAFDFDSSLDSGISSGYPSGSLGGSGAGSSVSGSGGNLDSILSSIGSLGGNSSGYDNSYLKDYMDAIEDSKNSSAEALRQMIEQGLAQLNNQKDDLSGEYNEAAQQNYINSMLNQRDLPQLMAAQGLNGGATESANLALLTNYEDNQNNLNQTYQQNLANVSKEIAELYSTGSINLSNLEAAYGKDTANAILQAGQQAANLQSQQGMAVFQAQIQAILDQANRDYQAQKDTENRLWQAQQDAINRQWQAQQNAANREYQQQQTLADREYQQQQTLADREYQAQQADEERKWKLEYDRITSDREYDNWMKKQQYSAASKASGSGSGGYSRSGTGGNAGTGSAPLMGTGDSGGSGDGKTYSFNGLKDRMSNFFNAGINGAQQLAARQQYDYYTNLFKNGQLTQDEYIRHVKPYADILDVVMN